MLVEVGARRYACHAMDISAQGAKVSPQVPLRSGTAVRLQFVPPDGPLLRLGAVVWRVDADGLAFLFARNLEHEVTRRSCWSDRVSDEGGQSWIVQCLPGS